MRHLLLSAFITSTLVLTGCASDGSSLFVTGVAGLSDECVVDDSVRLLSAIVDVSQTPSLTIFPVFASQLRDRVGANAANPADMHVRWVDVRLEDLGGNTLNLGLPNPFRVPTSVFIESFGGSGSPSTGSGAVEVLPPSYPEAVAAVAGGRALVALRPIGRTNGGIEVEGNFDFHYEIRICNGCLTRCAEGDETAVIPCTPGQNEETILECTP
ncbi:MAG: hypothetical protein R3B40_02515 [Polyangiales bacterium]|nr:hypothetical protein [Myxococcales bacterium]MCB9657054.1 hypothetical protein [Sandaracinaceae bacterium]